MENFGEFHGHLVFFVAILVYFCGHVCVYFPVLVCCTKKNLATLVSNVNHYFFDLLTVLESVFVLRLQALFGFAYFRPDQTFFAGF
jgi:hypothetical protein